MGLACYCLVFDSPTYNATTRQPNPPCLLCTTLIPRLAWPPVSQIYTVFLCPHSITASIDIQDPGSRYIGQRTANARSRTRSKCLLHRLSGQIGDDIIILRSRLSVVRTSCRANEDHPHIYQRLTALCMCVSRDRLYAVRRRKEGRKEGKKDVGQADLM